MGAAADLSSTRFMQSDPWWSFAMAVNVFLVFFFGANPAAFRKYLWVYCVICFGTPAIPAIVCLLIPTSDGKIYGDATVRGISRRPTTIPANFLSYGAGSVTTGAGFASSRTMGPSGSASSSRPLSTLLLVTTSSISATSSAT